MKFKSICLSSMLIYGLYIGTAQPEAVLTSKAYVDNKVPAYNSATESQSLLTDTTTTGTIAKRAIFTDGTTYVAGTHATQIPTMGAVMSAISSATPSLPTGTNGNIVTYNAQGQIGGSLDPATLQTAIPARATKIDNSDQTFAPSVVTNGTTDGDVGQMAIITYDRMNSDGFLWDDYANTDSLIPTLEVVGMEMERMNADLPWNTAEQNATGAYNTTFADSGTNVWPRADQIKVVKGQTFAKAMATKQNKITGHAANAADSLLTDSATDGTVQKRAIFNDTAANYDSTTQSTQIPTMGAVMSAISSDSQSPIPAGTNGYLATHSGTEGTFGTPVNPATFQTAITTGLVNWDDGSGTATPTFDALVSYDTTNGVVGNKIGVYDTIKAGLPLDSILDDDNIYNYYMTGNNRALVKNTVPNLYSLLPVLRGKQNKITGYNSSTQSQSVLTDTTTDGVVGKVQILNSDINDGDALNNWEDLEMIPTAGAVYQVAQEKIAGHSANAADSLLTDSTTTGTVQKRAIFNDTAANYDSTTQSTQIPTMGAVMSAVSAGTNAVDVSSHTVNGAPLSNSASYFYGESSTAAATAQKEVSIPSITSLQTGQIIVVKPTVTSTAGAGSLKLNDFDAYPMWYNGAALTTSTDSIAWSAQIPSVWLFDGSHWRFVARGYDANNTYSVMSVAEGTAGTATSARSMYAANLKQIIQGTTLTGLSTADATAVVATDSITTGIGKLQAQITDVAGDIPTLPTGTADSLVTYGANGTFGERGVEATALGTSTSATTVPTTGVVVSAFNTKFPANGGTDKVVTLSSTAGAPSSRNIVTTLTNGGTNIPTDGAVYSAVGAKQDKATCTEYKPNSNNTICYAYTFADISAQQQSTKTPVFDPIE